MLPVVSPNTHHLTFPQDGWPRAGQISIQQVSFRYRAELPLVLTDISVTIGEFYDLT